MVHAKSVARGTKEPANNKTGSFDIQITSRFDIGYSRVYIRFVERVLVN